MRHNDVGSAHMMATPNREIIVSHCPLIGYKAKPVASVTHYPATHYKDPQSANCPIFQKSPPHLAKDTRSKIRTGFDPLAVAVAASLNQHNRQAVVK